MPQPVDPADLPAAARHRLCGTWVPELGPCITERPCPEHDHPIAATSEPPCWRPGAHGQPVCVREFHRVPCAECPTPTARQPATPPAVPSGAAPAAAGPHPDTPDRAAGVPSRVYVAGPITGIADYRERFAAAAKQVKAAGYVPVTPVHDHDDRPWEWYMRAALLLMLGCDRVLLLPGWEASRGARLERQVATACGMPAAESVGQLASPPDGRPEPAPSPATSLAPGVLGRALLDEDGDLWPESATQPGMWRVPSGKTRGGQTVVEVVAVEPPAREVLLVSPAAFRAAGRVLDAAREWRRCGPSPMVSEEHDLATAVDALDGDQPAAPAPERDPARLVADPIHTCVTPRGRREDCAGCFAEAAELAVESGTPATERCTALTRHTDVNGDDMIQCDNQLPCAWHPGEIPEPDPADDAEMDDAMAEFVALPDCTHCDGSGKDVPPGWYERQREAERRAAEVIQPVVDALTPEQFDELVAAGRPGPAPEPDSGPGWDDGRIQEIIEFHASEDPQAFLVSDPGEVADQLRALLRTGRTVRTGLAWMRDAQKALGSSMREQQRLIREVESVRARAELAESRLDGQAWENLTADRQQLRAAVDRLSVQLAQVSGQRGEVQAEVERLHGELATARRDAAATCRDSSDVAERREALISQLHQYLDSCVWIDPDRCSGAPCLGGQRLEVDLIAGLMADGMDGDAIRGFYPEVTDEHLTAVRHFVREVKAERRDAAAYTLADAAQRYRQMEQLEATSHPAYPSDIAETLESWAAEIRRKDRPVPGSPQPAPAGGEEPT